MSRESRFAMRLDGDSQMASAPLKQSIVTDLLQRRFQQGCRAYSHIRGDAQDHRGKTVWTALPLQVLILTDHRFNGFAAAWQSLDRSTQTRLLSQRGQQRDSKPATK